MLCKCISMLKIAQPTTAKTILSRETKECPKRKLYAQAAWIRYNCGAPDIQRHIFIAVYSQ